MYHRPLRFSSTLVKAKKNNPVAAAADEQRALVPIRVAGVPEPFNLPFVLGLERRAFVRAGLEVKWRTVPEGTGEMCRLLEKGEVDVAVLVTEGAVRYMNSGAEVRMVATLVDSSLTWGVYLGNRSESKGPKDLKGVPYLISRFNSGSHLMAMMHAKKQGWTPTEKDFEVVNDLEGAMQRLASDKPATFLWENAITAKYVHAGDLRCVDLFKPDWPAFVVVARSAFMEEHSDALVRLMRVFRDQAKGLKEKKSAADMIAHRYGMTVLDAKEWLEEVKWSPRGAVDPASMAKVLAALAEVGLADLPAQGDALSENKGTK